MGAMILAEVGPAGDDDYDRDEDDAYPVGPQVMWLTYQACTTCCAEKNEPCVGSSFVPHPGRPRRWEV